MGIFTPKFFDKYGNFNNEKFVELLEEARKKQSKGNNKKGISNIEITLFDSVSKKEVWQFINKFSIFLNSGIDVKGALNILIKQFKNPYLKRIVTEIRDNIDHGIAINETMNSYPKVFDNLTISLIKVGEKTGKLSHILSELDTSMLESLELKGKVKGAMIYPSILLLLTLSMVTFMMIFIVPRVTDAFAKAGASLPAPTQVVLNISRFLGGFTKDGKQVKYNSNGTCEYQEFVFITKGNKKIKKPTQLYFGSTKENAGKKSCKIPSKGLYVLLALIITIIIFKFLNKTYYGKTIFSNLAIKLPIFGYIVKQSNIVYFIKSFTILLNSGVLLLESLKISSQVVSNLAYKKELIRIKNEVEIGLTISKSLGLNLEYENSVYQNKLFSEEFAYVVATGEETGSLSKSLEKIGKSYNSELKRYIGNLSSMMEPIIIVIVGALVGSIIIAIMMPFFKMGEVAKNL